MCEKYEICKLKGRKDNCFLLCLTTDRIMEYLQDIENETMLAKSEGVLIIDQLLSTGNGKNRYIACPYKNGKIDINSSKTIEPIQDIKKSL